MSDSPVQTGSKAQNNYLKDVLGIDVNAYTIAGADGKTINLRLSDKQVQDIIGTDTGVKRAQVEKELASFLTTLGAAQGLHGAVRVTDRVRMAGDALATGMTSERLTISMLLQPEGTFSPPELGRKIAAALPDSIPQANFQKLLDMKPKDVAAPPNLSLAGALSKLIEPGVKQVIGFLPKDIQKKVLDGLEDAVAKGLVGIADKAMEGAGLDGATKEALHSAVEAAIKQKDGLNKQ